MIHRGGDVPVDPEGDRSPLLPVVRAPERPDPRLVRPRPGCEADVVPRGEPGNGRPAGQQPGQRFQRLIREFRPVVAVEKSEVRLEMVPGAAGVPETVPEDALRSRRKPAEISARQKFPLLFPIRVIDVRSGHHDDVALEIAVEPVDAGQRERAVFGVGFEQRDEPVAGFQIARADGFPKLSSFKRNKREQRDRLCRIET